MRSHVRPYVLSQNTRRTLRFRLNLFLGVYTESCQANFYLGHISPAKPTFHENSLELRIKKPFIVRKLGTIQHVIICQTCRDTSVCSGTHVEKRWY
jgi:hypothetical protein